jgi:hypothetical protein
MLGFERCMNSGVEAVVQAPQLSSSGARKWVAATVIGAAVIALLLYGPVMVREHRNDDDRARGTMFETGEQWSDAVAHYEAVLARDATLQFAQEGLGRSSRRAALDAELAGFIATPGLLSTPEQHAAAMRALARGEATIPRTGRLAGQIAQLRAALQMPESR